MKKLCNNNFKNKSRKREENVYKNFADTYSNFTLEMYGEIKEKLQK